MNLSKHLAFVLVLSTGLLGPVLGGCAAAEDDDSVGPSSEDNFTADIKKSEELLAKAEKLAARRAADSNAACDENIFQDQIVDLVRQAIKARDTVFFRTSVVAKKPALQKEFAGTLFWQEVLGVYNPAKPDTLAAAFSAGVSLWDTNGGAFGNQERIELKAGGKAVFHKLDTESKDFHWNATPTTWKLEKGKLTLGNGMVFQMTWKDGMLSAGVPGKDFASFVDIKSECEA